MIKPGRVLVAGWFSYFNGHATAGDLLARDLVCGWLADMGLSYDVAAAPPFQGDVAIETADPARYTHCVFVCGPFERGQLEEHFLKRFSTCRLIGLNLSMSDEFDGWHPFDLLIERDSRRKTNADLVFGACQEKLPLVGVCLVEPHPGVPVDLANAAIERLVKRSSGVFIPVDTRLDVNATGLRTQAEVETLISRLDALVTTRLHGLVLALKNDVPALVVDAVPGGGKISRQCARIGWPYMLLLEEADDTRLAAMLAQCLTSAARAQASQCRAAAAFAVVEVRKTLESVLSSGAALERNFLARQTDEGRASFLQRVTPEPARHDSDSTADEVRIAWRKRVKSVLRRVKPRI